MSIIKVDPAKVQAIANTARAAELKTLLADSDYKVLPDYDKDGAAIKAQRQAWREEIRALEASSGKA